MMKGRPPRAGNAQDIQRRDVDAAFVQVLHDPRVCGAKPWQRGAMATDAVVVTATEPGAHMALVEQLEGRAGWQIAQPPAVLQTDHGSSPKGRFRSKARRCGAGNSAPNSRSHCGGRAARATC